MGGCFQDHGEAVVFCRDQQKDYMVSFSVADMKLKVISGHKVHEQKALPRLAQVNS